MAVDREQAQRLKQVLLFFPSFPLPSFSFYVFSFTSFHFPGSPSTNSYFLPSSLCFSYHFCLSFHFSYSSFPSSIFLSSHSGPFSLLSSPLTLSLSLFSPPLSVLSLPSPFPSLPSHSFPFPLPTLPSPFLSSYRSPHLFISFSLFL